MPHTYGWRSDYRYESIQFDDFYGSENAGAISAQMGWALASAGTSGWAQQAVELHHPGIFRLSTGATINTVAAAAPSNVTSVHADDIWQFYCVVRVNAVDASTQVRVGLASSATGDSPTDGVYWERLGSEVNWRLVTRSGGSQTRTAISPVTGGWDSFAAQRYDASTIQARFGAGGWTSMPTTNVPTGVGLLPFIQVKNTTAINCTFDIDVWESYIGILSERL